MTLESNISLAATQKTWTFPVPEARAWDTGPLTDSSSMACIFTPEQRQPPYNHQGRNKRPRPNWANGRVWTSLYTDYRPRKIYMCAHCRHLCLRFRLTRKWALNTGHKSAEDGIPTVPLSEHWPLRLWVIVITRVAVTCAMYVCLSLWGNVQFNHAAPSRLQPALLGARWRGWGRRRWGWGVVGGRGEGPHHWKSHQHRPLQITVVGWSSQGVTLAESIFEIWTENQYSGNGFG